MSERTALALMAAPLVLGHLYMAVINPSSRVGLHGMISGFVDQRWAQSLYPLVPGAPRAGE